MRAFIVAGLGFGDEGKGRMVDALVRAYRSRLVVRYNGGAQAAHHVVCSDGREHCFSQFGAGTLAGAQTFLSRFVTRDLPALMREADGLQRIGVEAPLRRLYVDLDCPVVTRYHRALNVLRELARGANRHGSCGRGIGEVAGALARGEQVLRVRDLYDPMRAGWLLRQIRARCLQETSTLDALHRSTDPVLEACRVLQEEPDEWVERYAQIASALQIGCPPLPETTIFEGAQGVLLDEDFGFHPHTTWSNCTFEQAETLCDEWGLSYRERIGVTRTYATRHGEGPLPSSCALSLGLLNSLRKKPEHNGTGPWQGEFRLGALDLPLLAYACTAARPNVLAVTHVDCITGPWPMVTSYGGMTLAVTRGDLASQEALGTALSTMPPDRVEAYDAPSANHVMDLMRVATQVPVAYFGMGPISEQTSMVLAGAF